MKVRRHQLPRVRKKPPSPAPVSVDANADCQTIVVQAPVAEVYRRCLHFEEFPRFISSIREIDRIDDTSFSCVIRGRETHRRALASCAFLTGESRGRQSPMILAWVSCSWIRSPVALQD